MVARHVRTYIHRHVDDRRPDPDPQRCARGPGASTFRASVDTRHHTAKRRTSQRRRHRVSSPARTAPDALTRR